MTSLAHKPPPCDAPPSISPGPSPLASPILLGPPDQPALVKYIERQAARYRSIESDEADLVAECLAALARHVGSLASPGQPITVNQYRDRRDTLWEMREAEVGRLRGELDGAHRYIDDLERTLRG